MWRSSLWFTVALVLAAIVVIFTAPLNLLSSQLRQQLPALKFSTLQGSLSKGELTDVNVDLGSGILSLGRVQWSLELFSLLNLAPMIDVEIEAPGHRLKAQVTVNTLGEVRISDAGGHFPISILEPWMPLWVSGDIRVQINEFSFANNQITGLVAMLAAFDTEWTLGESRMPLGSYLAEVNLRDGDVLVEIYDQQAALGMTGDLRITPSGAYHFKAVLTAREQLVPEITRSIKWLGKSDGQGGVVIDSKGQLQ